jgi:hypothetical protein
MNWRSHSDSFDNCDTILSENDTGMVILDGTLSNLYKKYGKTIGNIYVKYWAPASQSDVNNISGVNIPFPNEEIAFQDTLNKGVIEVENNKFRFELYRPQSYYMNVGDKPVRANVKFIFCDKKMRPFSNIYNVII